MTKNLDTFVNLWGYYPWSSAHGEEYIHPDDFERFTNLWPIIGRLFQCIGHSEGYLILRHDNDQFRVEPELYYALPEGEIAFEFGDMVETITGTKRVGVIRDIRLHGKREAYMYFIRVGNKKITKRYWEEDLRLLEKENR